MSTSTRFYSPVIAVVFLAWSGHAVAQDADPGRIVEVKGGTAAFEVGTNVGAISVHGKSSEVTARLKMLATADGATLEGIEASVPVKSIGTGMGLRDSHMRKYVFTTGDGQTPDLHFSADKATCAKDAPKQSTCQLTGNLAIRGTARPFTVVLKVSEDGDSLRAVGDGKVALSQYGIDRPSQLGVTTEDDVKLKFDLTAKQSARPVATSGRR